MINKIILPENYVTASGRCYSRVSRLADDIR